MRVPFVRAGLAAVATVFACGCGSSSIRSSAVPTGPLHPAPYAGTMTIYVPGRTPEGVEVGRVEVRGYDEDGSIDKLFPVFVAKVAKLGGDVVAVDRVDAEFESSMLYGYGPPGYPTMYGYGSPGYQWGGYGTDRFGTPGFSSPGSSFYYPGYPGMAAYAFPIESMCVVMSGRALRRTPSSKPGDTR